MTLLPGPPPADVPEPDMEADQVIEVSAYALARGFRVSASGGSGHEGQARAHG